MDVVSVTRLLLKFQDYRDHPEACLVLEEEEVEQTCIALSILQNDKMLEAERVGGRLS